MWLIDLSVLDVQPPIDRSLPFGLKLTRSAVNMNMKTATRQTNKIAASRGFIDDGHDGDKPRVIRMRAKRIVGLKKIIC